MSSCQGVLALEKEGPAKFESHAHQPGILHQKDPESLDGGIQQCFPGLFIHPRLAGSTHGCETREEQDVRMHRAHLEQRVENRQGLDILAPVEQRFHPLLGFSEFRQGGFFRISERGNRMAGFGRFRGHGFLAPCGDGKQDTRKYQQAKRAKATERAREAGECHCVRRMLDFPTCFFHPLSVPGPVEHCSGSFDGAVGERAEQVRTIYAVLREQEEKTPDGSGDMSGVK